MRLGDVDFTSPVRTVDDLVEVRGVHVPRRLDGVVFTWLDDDDAVAFKLTVDVEIVGEHVTCRRLVVDAGTQDVTKAMLGWIDPTFYGRHVLALAAMVQHEGKPHVFSPDPEAAARALAEVPKRRTVTTARLIEVAEAYLRGGAAAVQRDCNVSKAQAYRLVAQARTAELLPKAGEA